MSHASTAMIKRWAAALAAGLIGVVVATSASVMFGVILVFSGALLPGMPRLTPTLAALLFGIPLAAFFVAIFVIVFREMLGKFTEGKE